MVMLTDDSMRILREAACEAMIASGHLFRWCVKPGDDGLNTPIYVYATTQDGYTAAWLWA